MSAIFDTHGIREENIDDFATLLSKTLNVTFNPHENSTWGDYYLFHSEDWKEEISLQKNLGEDEDGDCWRESKFKQYSLILEVDLPMIRAKDFEDRIKQAFGSTVSLLRRSEYPD